MRTGHVLLSFRGNAGTSFPSFIYKLLRKQAVVSAEAEGGDAWAQSGRMSTGAPGGGQGTCLLPLSGLFHTSIAGSMNLVPGTAIEY